jgi:predicted methyltransferase
MLHRTSLPLAFALVSAGCNAGPEPKDASDAPGVPIYNTAAVVENANLVTDVAPAPRALMVLDEPDRDARDRALDARYQAVDLLSFLGIPEGARVAELAAGGGYFTELFARDVGPTGQVFANQPSEVAVSDSIKAALKTRLARPVNARVVASDRPLEAPLPEGARDLDLVYLSLPYRTAVRLGVSTSAMDRSVFAALRHGGRFVVLDYRPLLPGPSPVNLHTLHTEESRSVRRQVEAAGFEFITEGRFLRNDPRPYDWGHIDAERPTALEEQDRFVLAFRKP